MLAGAGEGKASVNIDDMDRAMRNWARWAHDQVMPKLDIPEPPMSKFWNPYGTARDPGWGETVPGDRIEDAIDWTAAEAIDRVLLRLPVRVWYILRRHYLQHATQPEIELQACLRALSDLITCTSFSFSVVSHAGITRPAKT